MGHAQYPLPLFAPDSPEVAAGGFWVFFLSLYLLGPEFPPAAHAGSIFSPT